MGDGAARAVVGPVEAATRLGGDGAAAAVVEGGTGVGRREDAGSGDSGLGAAGGQANGKDTEGNEGA